MAEGRPRRRSVNYDINKIVKNYFKLTAKSEIRFDLFMPLIISVLVSLIIYISRQDIIELLKEFNEVVITVMSILAGFNTASIAIVSSSNPLDFVRRMENGSNDNESSRAAEGLRLLNSLTTYFSYAIILQLFILIVSMIASLVLKFINFQELVFYKYMIYVLLSFFTLWFTLVLNSLFITLRNASILHNFILYLAQRR